MFRILNEGEGIRRTDAVAGATGGEGRGWYAGAYEKETRKESPMVVKEGGGEKRRRVEKKRT